MSISKRTTRTVTISLPSSIVGPLGRVRRIPVADPEGGEAEAAKKGGEAIGRGEFVTLDKLFPKATGLAISGAGLHKRARAPTKPTEE